MFAAGLLNHWFCSACLYGWRLQGRSYCESDDEAIFVEDDGAAEVAKTRPDVAATVRDPSVHHPGTKVDSRVDQPNSEMPSNIGTPPQSPNVDGLK